MSEKLDLFKCNICGNIIEIVENHNGNLSCCGKNMIPCKELEVMECNPHYGIVETLNTETKRIYFKHEMNEEHYIKFIEVIRNDKKYIKRKYLKFNEIPEIIFKYSKDNDFYVRILCNKDGVLVTRY